MALYHSKVTCYKHRKQPTTAITSASAPGHYIIKLIYKLHGCYIGTSLGNLYNHYPSGVSQALSVGWYVQSNYTVTVSCSRAPAQVSHSWASDSILTQAVIP